jgi:beta-lactamase class D
MLLSKALVGAGIVSLLTACGAAREPLPTETAHRATSGDTASGNLSSRAPSADSSLTMHEVKARPELARAFEEEHVRGGIALFDTANGELSASDPALAKRPFSPASTFKIAHTAIALELGILDDPDSPMPWDGEYSSNPEWNRDHTLRTAMQVSCVPCYQRVARSIGPMRMQEWVERVDYGNHDASGKVDRFWLDGKLRITAIEQLDFLRRLDTGRLPLSTRTVDIVRDVIALDVGASHVLYAKTGLAGPAEGDVEVGWFVGFVALEKRTVYFATIITGVSAGTDIKPLRRRVTEHVLRSLGVLPGPDSPAAPRESSSPQAPPA